MDDDGLALAALVLGVSPHASYREGAAAYRRLVAAHHPDRGGSPATFRRVDAAWRVFRAARPADEVVVDVREPAARPTRVVNLVNAHPWQAPAGTTVGRVVG